MINFVDRQFKLDETLLYKLSIQISLDGFLLYISDGAGNCLVAKSFVLSNIDDLDNIFTLEPLLRKEFKKVNCVFINPKAILVPASIFNEKEIESYLNFVCRLDDLDMIMYKQVDAIEAYSIFTVNKKIFGKIRRYQKEAEFYNQNIPLIYGALNIMGKNINVCFQHNFIDIIVSDNGKLLLSNSYKTESLSDAVYFIAAVQEQLNLCPDLICLSGKVGRAEEEELTQFFDKTELEMNRKLIFTIGAENSLELLTLQKLSRCE